MVSGLITSWQIDGENVKTLISFSWAPKSVWMVTTAKKLKDAASQKASHDKPRQQIKKLRHHFASKISYSQSYGFSSSRVQMCELDHEEN